MQPIPRRTAATSRGNSKPMHMCRSTMKRNKMISVRLSTIEFFAAFGVFLWGMYVFLFGPDASLSAPAFVHMRSHAAMFDLGAHVFYGLGAVFVASAYAVAIKVNGQNLYWTPPIRWATCLLTGAFFVQISTAVWQQQPSSTGVVTYGLIGFYFLALSAAHIPRVGHSAALIWERLNGRTKRDD